MQVQSSEQTFFKGPSSASFSFFSVFSKTNINTILQEINLKKCPSSIRRWDYNPWPSARESPPITTSPGHPLFNLLILGKSNGNFLQKKFYNINCRFCSNGRTWVGDIIHWFFRLSGLKEEKSLKNKSKMVLKFFLILILLKSESAKEEENKNSNLAPKSSKQFVGAR